ncbi:MAG: CHAP domain-containing protein [Treponema sp.]|nr:CHAP domain-containing protein [Treponema sp.]
MKLQEFVVKHYGKKVDFDGAFGAQCVDLARQYFKDVWGFTKQPEGVEGAKDFFYNHDNRPVQKELCICIPFANDAKPPEGSVCVYKESATNKYGHIGICLNADDTGVDLFEQDGFKQDGAKITRWDYSRLVGWLEKRNNF